MEIGPNTLPRIGELGASVFPRRRDRATVPLEFIAGGAEGLRSQATGARERWRSDAELRASKVHCSSIATLRYNHVSRPKSSDHSLMDRLRSTLRDSRIIGFDV